MKTNKMITIDVELAQRLQEEPNASKIINELLVNYYGHSKEELSSAKKQISNEIDELLERKKNLLAEERAKESKLLNQKLEEKKLKESGLSQEQINFFHNSSNWLPKDKLNNYKLKFGHEISFSEYCKLSKIALGFKKIENADNNSFQNTND